MKRFHIHIAVDNLTKSIDFSNKFPDQTPDIERPDYARWLLNEPELDFAISSRGHTSGITHLDFMRIQQINLSL